MLVSEDLDRFNRGRKLFAKRWPLTKGALLNADSCVACHRVPMPGGSGATHDTFVANSPELIPLYKSVRPGFRIDDNYEMVEVVQSNVTVLRRTQSLYGLGLLEAAVIPGDDTDLLHPSGVGRFGWKAEFRSIEEFVQHAFKAELGISIENTNKTPVTSDDLAAVTAYIRFLAPPPRKSFNTNSLGFELFCRVQCNSCHTPTLRVNGYFREKYGINTVQPYTDLRLHDVGGGLSDGITVGKAGASVFRTPPLWGLFALAPYLHDGSATTIQEAVTRHGGEAEDSVQAFKRLKDGERDILLEFLKSL
jgi:hypothetical protein